MNWRHRWVVGTAVALLAMGCAAAMNTAPLRRMIEQIVDEAMVREIAEQYGRGRILVVATTNFDAGRAVIWNIGAIAATGHPKAIRLIHDVLMASAAIPAVFPPVMIRVEAEGQVFEEMHMDGGTKAQVFLYPPSLDLRAQTEARGLGHADSSPGVTRCRRD